MHLFSQTSSRFCNCTRFDVILCFRRFPSATDAVRHRVYKTWGVSILAAQDLQSGRVTARVERRHRSQEFVAPGRRRCSLASMQFSLGGSVDLPELNRLLSIGIGGGIGWVMLLNVWGVIWHIQKRLIQWTGTTPPTARSSPTKPKPWPAKPS
jgi:hypothetical protein